jgi:DNA-binding response OmpR family regulator
MAHAVRRKILLVDNDLTVQLAMRAILEMNGFAVETASSAREAIECLQANTYAMVITESQLETPTSGSEVLRAARSQAYDPATAILSAHANAMTDWVTQGAQSFLVKAMNTGDLMRQIEALLVNHEDYKAERMLSALTRPDSADAKTKKAEKDIQKAV